MGARGELGQTGREKNGIVEVPNFSTNSNGSKSALPWHTRCASGGPYLSGSPAPVPVPAGGTSAPLAAAVLLVEVGTAEAPEEAGTTGGIKAAGPAGQKNCLGKEGRISLYGRSIRAHSQEELRETRSPNR